jgi:hypothetical protein
MLARNANEAMLIATPAGLPGGAEDRLARHQPQVRRAGRGAERHECATQVRDTYNDMLEAVKPASPNGAHQRRDHPADGRASAAARSTSA